MANDFAPVFEGWNVWSVYQKKDLDFELTMVGLDRDRRLRIWVEDAVRLGAPNAKVADPIDLKGGQIQILPSPPADLSVKARKEDVGGPSALMLDGPAELRTVRFFNRGAADHLTWPHDANYLLNEVFQPSASSPATTGGAPSTIGETVATGAAGAAGDLAKPLTGPVVAAVAVAAVVAGGVLAWKMGAFSGSGAR